MSGKEKGRKLTLDFPSMVSGSVVIISRPEPVPTTVGDEAL